MNKLNRFSIFLISYVLFSCSCTYIGKKESESIGLEKISNENSCGYFYGDSRVFESIGARIKKGDDYIEQVVATIGLPANFDVGVADIDNAVAFIDNGKRIIVYDEEFLNYVKEKSKNDWSAISIVAHEIGHHLAGHTLNDSQSRPEIELEADRFSGYVMYRLGAPLEAALSAVSIFGSEVDSETHPSKSRRQQAIRNGYLEAKEAAADMNNLIDLAKTDDIYEVNIKSNEGFCTLRNRSLSPEEYAIVNKNNPQAGDLNEQTIMRRLENGTKVRILSAVGNTYFVKVIDTGELGYMLKSYNKMNTLKKSN